jgi:hypothetical protein
MLMLFNVQHVQVVRVDDTKHVYFSIVSGNAVSRQRNGKSITETVSETIKTLRLQPTSSLNF